MRATALFLLLAAGCGEDPPAEPAAAPVEAPAATPAPAPAPAPATAATAPKAPPPESAVAPPSDGVWTPATIAALTPKVPAREGKTPFPMKETVAVTKTLERLEAVVEKHGGDPDNPWAIGHGLIAMGPDFTLSNGEKAVEWLFKTYAVELHAEGATTVQFPRQTRGIRVEPHKQLMLKAMTEAGVSPDRPVTVQGKPHTVADLYRGAVVATWLVPERNHSSFSSPNDMPWAVQSLSAWAPDKRMQWTALDTTPMKLNDLVTFNASVLVAETQPLFQAMQAGAQLRKNKQGIWGYTCGGAHLLQGTAYAVARGHSTDLAKQAIQGQVALHYWRLPGELAVYDAALKRSPEHQALLLTQRMKFLGHWLETAHKLAILGFYTPTEEQKRLAAGAVQQLALTVEALEQGGVFKSLPEIEKTDYQLYLDVVGDASHAVHGLRLALGEHTVAW